MKDKQLWIPIGFSIFGLINAIVFITLTCLKILNTEILYYFCLPIYLVAIWLPSIIEKLSKIKFNLIIIICYQIFLMLTLVAGTIWRVYDYVVWFDKLVHFASGILFALVCYNLIENSKKTSVSLFWLFLVTFSFSMMIGGVWEICEFSCDSLVNGNAQQWKNLTGHAVLFDTMFDLICDFVGSLIGASIAVLLENKKRKTQNN